MISLCFDEVADRTTSSDHIQPTIIADQKTTFQAFHETLWSGMQHENIVNGDLCTFFRERRKEIAPNDFRLEPEVDRL
jgi:hypothetical protein